MVGIRALFTCFTQAFHLHSWTGHSQVRPGFPQNFMGTCGESSVNILYCSFPFHGVCPWFFLMAAKGTTRYPAPLSHRKCPSPLFSLPSMARYPPSCFICSISKQCQLSPGPLPEHPTCSPTAPEPLQTVLHTQLLYSLRR